MHPSLLANLLGPDGLIIIVVVIVVLLFGGNKLPKLARGLGAASHEFRKGIEEGDAEAKKVEAGTPESARPDPASAPEAAKPEAAKPGSTASPESNAHDGE